MIYADLAEGEAFEDTKMPIILRNAASIRLLAPLGLEALEEYGLSEPQATVQVRYRKLVETDETAELDDDDVAVESADAPTEDDLEKAEPEYIDESYTLAFGAELEMASY